MSGTRCQSEREADWPFDQEPNVAAITTRQVLEQGFPILLVTHYEDDHSWAFLCGTTNKHLEDGRVIGMGEALDLDCTLASVADLPPGWSAWREDKDSEWIRYQRTES